MKPNILTLIIVTLIIVGGGYWYFSSQSTNDAALTGTEPAESPAQSQFDLLVNQLQPISFNTSIFSDPRFTALVDLTTPIAPETPGRADPFAPIGSGGH
jgi:hypothetical protein